MRPTQFASAPTFGHFLVISISIFGRLEVDYNFLKLITHSTGL